MCCLFIYVYIQKMKMIQVMASRENHFWQVVLHFEKWPITCYRENNFDIVNEDGIIYL
jgi:hypothetical protein